MITSTEEDYIKTIFNISQSGKRELVGTNQIAQQMSTTAASVTDMLRKLSNKEMVVYEKYKGVKLSPMGTMQAMSLLRKHRLWESFLVEKLGFAWDEVHDIAEQLEHIQSNELVNRLDKYLGYPKFDPHGDPIPDTHGTITIRNQVVLSTMEAGSNGLVVGVKKHDKDFLNHLNQVGINIGTELELLHKYPYDQSIKLRINNQEEALLSSEVCENIYLKKIR